VIYFQGEGIDARGPQHPESIALPARGMSNLLKPFGIPYKAWSRRAPTFAPTAVRSREYPCQVTTQMGQCWPVYEVTGPMPDSTNEWIQTERGIRRLLAEELANAKGVTKAWYNRDP
jgi:hypothetical protein